MTRIVAGEAKGRQLEVPKGDGTRPTSDRAREGLFSTLTAIRGGTEAGLEGAAFLDLYAGSGAVGLEAASRGAKRVLLVEADSRAGRVIRANVTKLAFPGVEVALDRVERLAGAPNKSGPFDIAFLDPPYAVTADEVRGVLAALHANGWLAPEAATVVERASRDGQFAWPEGFAGLRSRAYGEGTLWYGLAPS